MQQLMLEAGTIQLEQVGKFRGRQHGRLQNHALRVLRRFLEYVTLGSDTGFQAHDDCFTQRIDRRVGDLSKLLTEIIRNVALFQ